MTFIHDTVIREYLSGKIIQFYLEGKWIDLPKYGTDKSIPTFLDANKYRVKPTNRYCFFHTTGVLLYKDMIVNDNYIMMFNYPEYEPSGPHVMIEYNDQGEIIKTYHSNTHSTEYFNEQNS